LASPSPRQSTVRSSVLSSALETGLLLGGYVLWFAYLPHALFTDDFTRFRDVERLLHHGHLSDSPFSLVMPLFSTPVLLLGEHLRTPEWWAARFNVLVLGGGALVAFLVLRGRVDTQFMRRVLLVLLFASFFTERLRDYNAEVFTSTLVAVGLLLLVVAGRPVLGWAAIAIGVANTPAALAGAALIAAAEVWRTRRLRHLLGPVFAAVLIMAEAWIRRGGPLVSGEATFGGVRTLLPYSGKRGFSYPFVLGVLSILFSFGRGIVFFMPGLLLGLARRTWSALKGYHRLVGYMVLYTAGLVAVYAKWWAWYGGISWGPRFFTFAAIPASVFIAARIQHAGESVLADAVTLLVLGLSGWIAVTGATADLSMLNVCGSDHFSHEAFCWYVPEFSSLWMPVLHFPELSMTKVVVAAWCALAFACLAAPLIAALGREAGRVRMHVDWALAGWRL
jgi:hypothetical protein